MSACNIVWIQYHDYYGYDTLQYLIDPSSTAKHFNLCQKCYCNFDKSFCDPCLLSSVFSSVNYSHNQVQFRFQFQFQFLVHWFSTWNFFELTMLAVSDGIMRGSLEAHLMFTPPSELLVAQPITNSTRRLLGSFSQSVRGLKAESIDGSKYSKETAEATIQAFYSGTSLWGLHVRYCAFSNYCHTTNTTKRAVMPLIYEQFGIRTSLCIIQGEGRAERIACAYSIAWPLTRELLHVLQGRPMMPQPFLKIRDKVLLKTLLQM